MIRPRLFTILALLLAWLAVGGLAFAVWASHIEARPTTQAAFFAVGLGYGITAGASALGLWRMRPWFSTMFRAWGITVSFAVLLPLLIVKAETGPLLHVALGILSGAALWWLAGYLRSRCAIATGAGRRAAVAGSSQGEIV